MKTSENPDLDASQRRPAASPASDGSAIPSGHPEAICDDCGGENVVWFAPSAVWNKVVRRPDTADPMLCPRCFILRAERAGIHWIWEVSPESPNARNEPRQ